MSRLPRLRPDQLDPAQSALYKEITGGPRAQGRQHFALTDDEGGLLGPFNALLYSPPLGTALQELGAAIRYRSTLSPRIRELAILIVANHWDSAFERDAHESVGRSVGLTDADLAALRAGGTPVLDDPAETAAVALCRALITGDVDDAHWVDARDRLGEETIFELTTLVGYYATLALQLRVFRV
jgi:4-carboxymuconolactone decarboxylase